MSKDTKFDHLYKHYTGIPDQVRDDNRLSWPEKITYSHILRRAHLTGYCFENQEIMAEILGYSYSYIKIIMQSLHKKNFISTNGARGPKWNCTPTELYNTNILEEPKIMYIVKTPRPI